MIHMTTSIFFLFCLSCFLLRAQTPDAIIGVWESTEPVQLHPSLSPAPKAFLTLNDDETFQLAFAYETDDDKEGRGDSYRQRCAVWLPTDSTCVVVSGTYIDDKTMLDVQVGRVTQPKHAPSRLTVTLGPFTLRLWERPKLRMKAILEEKGTKLILRRPDREATFTRLR